MPDGMSLENFNKKIVTLPEMDVIASGYEWTCEGCEQENTMHSIMQIMQCMNCKTEYRVGETLHSVDW